MGEIMDRDAFIIKFREEMLVRVTGNTCDGRFDEWLEANQFHPVGNIYHIDDNHIDIEAPFADDPSDYNWDFSYDDVEELTENEQMMYEYMLENL